MITSIALALGLATSPVAADAQTTSVDSVQAESQEHAGRTRVRISEMVKEAGRTRVRI